jgi:hypothetical protein
MAVSRYDPVPATGNDVMVLIARVIGHEAVCNRVNALSEEESALFLKALEKSVYHCPNRDVWQMRYGIFIDRMGNITVPTRAVKRNEDVPGFGQF